MQPEKIESKLESKGIDPEKLEEKLSPGLHKKMEKLMKEKDGKKKKKHAGHGFTHTHIEHHGDGSATIHHQHEDGAEHDVKHAATDLDGVHDSLEDHLGQPNPGEAEANAGPEGAAAGAAPAGGAPAAMPAQV